MRATYKSAVGYFKSNQTIPRHYWSRSLIMAKKAYDTTQREYFAIVWSELQLLTYLKRRSFTIRTDHNSLWCILNLADASGRHARWWLRLLEFDFDVVKWVSVKCRDADALFSLPTDGTDSSPLENGLSLMYINIVQNDNNDHPSNMLKAWKDFSSTMMHLSPKKKALKVPILTDVIKAQSENDFCQQAAKKKAKVQQSYR